MQPSDLVSSMDLHMPATSGLWRDGSLLVVDLNAANFAGRCPFTNETEGTTTAMPVFGPHPAGWNVTLRRGLHYGAKQELLKIDMPASKTCLQRRNAAKRKFGYMIAGVSVASLLAGTVLAI